MSARTTGPISRAAFDAFFARWLPRVHGFAARRSPTRAEAEAVTRAVLEAAVRAGLVAASSGVAPRLLALTKAELERTRAALA